MTVGYRFIPSRKSPCMARKCLFGSPRKKEKYVPLVLCPSTLRIIDRFPVKYPCPLGVEIVQDLELEVRNVFYLSLCYLCYLSLFNINSKDSQSEPPKVETLTYQSVLQIELLGKSITEVPVSKHYFSHVNRGGG